MAFDKEKIFNKKTLVIFLGAILVGGIIAAGIPLITGDAGSASRQKYAMERAGISPTQVPTATPSIPVDEELKRTPATVDDIQVILPPTAIQEDTIPPPPTKIGLIEDEVEPEIESIITQAEPTAIPPVPSGLLDSGITRDIELETTSRQLPSVEVAPMRYLFNNMTPEALGSGGAVISSEDPSADLNLRTFAPMGETIEVALMNNFASEDRELPVEAGVLSPFYFQGNKLLEVGDKIIGTAQAGKTRDRVNISWNKIIFKNGESASISGIALDTDGTVGVPGFLVGNQMAQSLVPILLEAASAVSSAFMEYAEVAAPSGLVPQQMPLPLPNGQQQQQQQPTEVVGSGFQAVPNSLTNAGIEAGQSALGTISEMIAKDIEENKPYLVVPAGTRARIFLTSPLDVSRRGFGM